MQRLFNQPFTQNKLPTLRGTSLNEISRFVHSLDQTDIAFYATKGIYLVPNFITHAMAAAQTLHATHSLVEVGAYASTANA